MSYISDEIGDQPAAWRKAADRGRDLDRDRFRPGRRLAVVGCGTSFHMAQAFAALREGSGLGEADAFPASEWPGTRPYDVVVALWRAHLGDDLEPTVKAAERALLAPLPGPDSLDHVVFLGQGWTVGLANEAALKLRETAGARSESYPAMEYLHGPIAAAGPGTLVWALDRLPRHIADEVRRAGASLVQPSTDPMASLVLAQRMALAMAEARGLDPDRPRHLARSVVLPAAPSPM